MRQAMSRPTAYHQAVASDSVQARMTFLKQVYGLLTMAVLAAMIGAFASLYLGAETSQVAIATSSGSQVVIPPLVAFFGNHWIIGGLLFLGSVFGASALRRVPYVNLGALLGMGLMAGLMSGPAVFVAQLRATSGAALTLNPVRDAFLVAVAAFVGLTVYALTSKRDFSFLRGFLSVGFWVVLAAMILGIFVQSSAFSLAIASAGVLLFSGFILYDTSRLLRSADDRMNPVGAAIGLFLNFLNLFLFLLRIFSGGRD